MFTLKKPSFLGIDFGMSHIKAVELTIKNDKPYLLNYGEVSVDFPDVKNDAQETQDPEKKTIALLKLLLKRMAPRSESAYVSMPGFSGLITLIELPKMNEKDLEKAVRFEAQRYIPSPMSEVALSWDVISKPSISINNTASTAGISDAPAESVEVLLVAALFKEVDKYERFIAESSLQMEMLELETFSLVRAIAPEGDGAHLIIDIGSRSTNLILVSNGFIEVNRNVNAGGHEITLTLSEALNIAWDRAETMKSGEKDFLNDRESTIVFPSLELVVSEARRMVAAHNEKHKGTPIQQVMLSGGASKMKGMDAYFSKMLNIPTRLSDPWAKIGHDAKLDKAISQLGVSYSVAIGLASAGIESHDRG